MEDLAPKVTSALSGITSSSPAENTQLASLIANRIRSLNQRSLQTKLADLMSGVPLPELVFLLDNPREPEKSVQHFPRTVADTRHFFTHYEEALAGRSLSGANLQRATATCWAILTFCLARTLGIREDIALKMAVKAKYAMFLIARSGEL